MGVYHSKFDLGQDADKNLDSLGWTERTILAGLSAHLQTFRKVLHWDLEHSRLNCSRALGAVWAMNRINCHLLLELGYGLNVTALLF